MNFIVNERSSGTNKTEGRVQSFIAKITLRGKMRLQSRPVGRYKWMLFGLGSKSPYGT